MAILIFGGSRRCRAVQDPEKSGLTEPSVAMIVGGLCVECVPQSLNCSPVFRAKT
jgi:hypothetical protein